ncbi:DNA topoisomerase IV subunit A [Malacoplasma iowae]|uniref:DNA topoisomerase IV subunit A n=2 Tax=Malacoplasma iowae TaxID=2116 RepID=UPI002A188A65|nr:DNA topoisomerase IV subunit A [Malacoplasma iowae]WPL37883.1 DNA topoisomerase IV subunit A [Malacoplasma iowae]WPL41275.1 DNA topoisomerase IV subunit A [Malacoplasma iowae]
MSNIFDNNNKIWNRSLEDIMSESFGKYAKYIIQDRALPDIRDGLKPVQRRILYAMNELKIHHDKPYKKSARTVGEVIGKYHPHGDSSIYEAMVRMSQEWKNNIPLLDMQGNKGSLDGDGPAAMRYTECRLSLFGELMLEDIDKDTVKFIPNFDDSESEPSILPSLLPNVLVNGSTGIAAGYATNVPPFNLSEVLQGIIYRIKHNSCSIKEIASIIKGPDFPTGGIIQGKDGILEIFATGKGKFNIRARISETVKSNKKTKQLVVTEIPYETNKANIVKSIEELRINNELPGLKEVRDDSDKNGVSIVMEFETDKDLEIIKNFLYKKTQLQISYSANIILIKDRKPSQTNIIQIIDSYLEHANDIIIRSATFDLKKALNRKEILEGLIKAIKDIDKLIRLIKSSKSKDEAKQKIMASFGLNQNQAEAVVNLRLYVLTSYDTEKLINEYNELLKFIDIKKRLIEDQNYRNQFLIDKLNEFDKKLGFKRKTSIEDEIEDIAIEQTDIIEENHGVCIVTRDNYIKYIKDISITDVTLDKFKFKEGDIPVNMISLSTLETLVCLTSKGKCITIPAHKIKFTKAKDNGIHINEIITIDSFEKTIAIFAISKNSNIKTEVFVATKNSLVKRFMIEDLTMARNAKISSYIGLKSDDEVITAFVVKDEYKEVITVSKNGNGLRYQINEVPVVGRSASGVKNINLKDDDCVGALMPVEPDESFILLISNRGAKRIHFEDITLTSRAKIGKRILSQVESNPYLIHSGFMIGGRETIYLLDGNNKLHEKKVSDIPITDFTTRMNSFNDVSEISDASYLKKNQNLVLNSDDFNFEKLLEAKNELKQSEIEEEIDDEIDHELEKLISKKIPLTINVTKINIDDVVVSNNSKLDLSETKNHIIDHSNLNDKNQNNELDDANVNHLINDINDNKVNNEELLDDSKLSENDNIGIDEKYNDNENLDVETEVDSEVDKDSFEEEIVENDDSNEEYEDEYSDNEEESDEELEQTEEFYDEEEYSDEEYEDDSEELSDEEIEESDNEEEYEEEYSDQEIEESDNEEEYEEELSDDEYEDDSDELSDDEYEEELEETEESDDEEYEEEYSNEELEDDSNDDQDEYDESNDDEYEDESNEEFEETEEPDDEQEYSDEEIDNSDYEEEYEEEELEDSEEDSDDEYEEEKLEDSEEDSDDEYEEETEESDDEQEYSDEEIEESDNEEEYEEEYSDEEIEESDNEEEYEEELSDDEYEEESDDEQEYSDEEIDDPDYEEEYEEEESDEELEYSEEDSDDEYEEETEDSYDEYEEQDEYDESNDDEYEEGLEETEESDDEQEYSDEEIEESDNEEEYEEELSDDEYDEESYEELEEIEESDEYDEHEEEYSNEELEDDSNEEQEEYDEHYQEEDSDSEEENIEDIIGDIEEYED